MNQKTSIYVNTVEILSKSINNRINQIEPLQLADLKVSKKAKINIYSSTIQSFALILLAGKFSRSQYEIMCYWGLVCQDSDNGTINFNHLSACGFCSCESERRRREMTLWKWILCRLVYFPVHRMVQSTDLYVPGYSRFN